MDIPEGTIRLFSLNCFWGIEQHGWISCRFLQHLHDFCIFIVHIVLYIVFSFNLTTVAHMYMSLEVFFVANARLSQAKHCHEVLQFYRCTSMLCSSIQFCCHVFVYYCMVLIWCVCLICLLPNSLYLLAFWWHGSRWLKVMQKSNPHFIKRILNSPFIKTTSRYCALDLSFSWGLFSFYLVCFV